MKVLSTKLFLILLLLGASATARAISPVSSNPLADGLLSRALPLAFKGELTDPQLIRQIETRYQRAENKSIRIFSAYLLTYAPRRLVAQNPLHYVGFVLAQPESGALIGEEAILRLLRIRADEAFEEGNFSKAIGDYSEILRRGKGFLRDYSVLKLGWSHMNLDQPAPAFTLWLHATNEKLSRGSNPSPNLVSGLAQAFVENQKRTPEEVAALGKLNLDEKGRHALFEGFNDGIDSLKTDAAMALLAKQTALLPYSKNLIEFIVDKTSVSGKRACQYLPWVRGMQGTLDYRLLGKWVEGCSIWVVKAPAKERPSDAVVAEVRALVPRFELKGPERKFRFEFYAGMKESDLACREGLEWLTATVKERAGAVVKSISEQCTQAWESGTEKVRSQMLSQLAAAARDTTYLSSENDPLLFVSTVLIRNSKFRVQLTDLVLTESGSFTKTLYPTLLAERAVADKDLERADRLLTGFGTKQIVSANQATSKAPAVADAKKNQVWQHILAQKIAAQIEQRKFSEALPLLKAFQPLDVKLLTGEGVRLWTVYLLKARETGVLQSVGAAPALEVLLTKSAVDLNSEIAPVVLDLGAELKQWDKVWGLIRALNRPFNTVASEKLTVELFETIAAGQLEPVGWEQSKDADLKFIVPLALEFRKDSFSGVPGTDPVGKTIIAKDARFLKDVSKKRTSALAVNRKKDLASQAMAWIRFLDHNLRGVTRHAWSSPRFSKAAQKVVGDFCSDAKAQIPGLVKTMAGDKDQVTQLASALEARLEECRQSTRKGNQS